MNYYGAQELAASFRTVRNNTIKIAEEIGEEHYNFSATPDTRTVAQILTHIAIGPSFQEQIHGERLTTLEGLDFPAMMAKIAVMERQPRNKQQIVDFLRQEGDRFAAWMEGLSDEFLAERVSMRPGMIPPSKSRFEMLLGAKEHEMHHRGQLMMMQRMVGMTPHLTREMQARMAEMLQAAKASA